MSESSTLSVLNSKLNEDNRSYWLLNSIRKVDQNDSLTKLMKSYFNDTTDINKDVVLINDGKGLDGRREYKISISKPSAMLTDICYEESFTWSSKSSNEMLNFLLDSGMDFKSKEIIFSVPLIEGENLVKAVENNSLLSFLSKFENDKIEKDTFFSLGFGYEPQRRVLELLRCVYKSIPVNEFIERAVESKILFEATKKDYFIVVDFLLNEAKVPVNVTDDSTKTPLMLCSSSITLEPFLKRADLNLFIKDKNDKDAFHYFSTLKDKKQSKFMVDLLQKFAKDMPAEELNQDSLIEASKKALLAMIVSDKNKKEIETFIKKSGIKNFDDIYDDKGRSMAQLAVAKDNWSKYNLIKKGYSKDFRDKVGYGLIEYILPKSAPKFQSKAIEVATEILDTVGADSGFNMLRRFMRLNRSFNIPKWYISDKTVEHFLSAFTNEDYTSKNASSLLSHVKSTPSWGSVYNYEEKTVNSLKEFAKPYFIHAINNGYADRLHEIDMPKLCQISDKYNAGKLTYESSITSLCNIAALLQLSNEFGINSDKLFEKVENTIVSYIKDGWTDVNQRTTDKGERLFYVVTSFVQDTARLLDFLIDNNSLKLKDAISDSYLTHLQKECPEMAPKVSSYLLNQELSVSLVETKKKVSKI